MKDTEILTLYTYSDDAKKYKKRLLNCLMLILLLKLETFTDEEINEHLLETYEEYVHHEFRYCVKGE